MNIPERTVTRRLIWERRTRRDPSTGSARECSSTSNGSSRPPTASGGKTCSTLTGFVHLKVYCPCINRAFAIQSITNHLKVIKEFTRISFIKKNEKKTFRQASVIRLGEHDTSDPNDGANPEDFGAATTIAYPEYNGTQAYHDIGLIRLKKRVNIQVQ